jgi:hypothetical protein
MLAAALDQMPTTVDSVSVSAEKDNVSAELLAVWLAWRLDVPVTRSTDNGPGITGVRMATPVGEIALTRSDGHLAALSMPGQPERHVALKRRETAELLSEELRRLDQDDIYAEVLDRVGAAIPAPNHIAEPVSPVVDSVESDGDGKTDVSGAADADTVEATEATEAAKESGQAEA